MARENSLIDEVLGRVDIVDVIGRYVPLKRSGSNFSGCCPFHHEKTPSFMVSQTKQIFKCFGCGVWWNVFSFIQESEKIDFRDAVKFLAEQEHIDVSSFQKNTSPEYYQHHQDEKEKLKRLHKLAQEFFVQNLQSSSDALQYLIEKRKLTDQIITDFGIGFAPDKSYELLQFLRSKGFTDDDLMQASLGKKSANNSDLFSFFRNRITFPIYDMMKNVVGFTARVLNPADQPKYLNSSEHKIFNKSKILYGLSHAKPYLTEFKKIIIVEGQMDVIWLARIGFPIGVASSGTALSDEHIKLLKRHIESLYLLFDNDEAGRQATFRALKLCYNQDFFPKIITLPSTIWDITIKDVDDVANLPDGKAIFQTALDNSLDWFLVMFNRLRSAWDMTSPVDKQKLINAMFELILSVNNLTIQEHYKVMLAEKLGYAPEILDAQFKKFKAGEWKFLLRQLSQQSEQTHQKEPFQLDRNQLFISLFLETEWESFLARTLPSEAEFVQALTDFASLIVKAIPDSELGHVENEDKMQEFHLRREKEFGNIDDEKTKKLIIQKTITPTNPGQPSPLMDYLKQAQKSSHLNTLEKDELNKLRVLIGKR